jgi:hypothetical protein
VSSLNRGASDEVERATIWRAATVDVRMSRLILAPWQPALVRASIKIFRATITAGQRDRTKTMIPPSGCSSSKIARRAD